MECDTTCRACGIDCLSGSALGYHIKSAHKLTVVDYTVKYLYDGVRPLCPVCGSETRYTTRAFKTYCSRHRHVAESEAGRIGGRIKRTWSKDHTKDTHPLLARFSRDFRGKGNHFYGKHHSSETIRRISDKKRLNINEVERRISIVAPDTTLLSSIDDYVDRQATLLTVQCDTCKKIDNVSLFNLERSWMCRTCHPVSSRSQLEIGRWIESLGLSVDYSTRSVIPPLELDIYVPQKNVAIEYHGLYWHSGGVNDVYDRQRHDNKRKMCEERGIRLIQLFSDEWRDKQATCSSIIRNALGLNEFKLNARDCLLVELDSTTAAKFMDEMHIAGATRCCARFGLIHPTHGLVACATLRKPIQRRWSHLLELARMAFSHGTTVRGGASRLLERCMKEACNRGREGLLSYADLRLGSGGVYDACGLTRVGETAISFWYTDNVARYDRFAFRAQNGMSEREYAASKNVRRVYGTANAVFVKHGTQKDEAPTKR